MNQLSRWDNPIFRREMRRLEVRSHRKRNLVLVVALVGILAMLFTLLLWMYPSPYDEPFIWMFFPAWAIWVIYAVTVFQVIVSSVGVHNAEYAGQSWEAMIVTGIGVQRILLGNWLAVIHHVKGWLLFLALARIAVLPVYLLVAVKVAPIECGAFGDGCVLQSLPSPGTWLGVIGITVVLTILDGLCCALIGLVASAITRHSRWAAVLAIALRFSPLVIFMAFGFNDANFWEWWASPPFALVDGGTAPAVQLVMPLLPRGIQFNPALGLCLITGAEIVLLLILVGISLVVLRLNGGSAG